MTEPNGTTREELSDIIDRIRTAKEALEGIKPKEHRSINQQVTQLYGDIEDAGYHFEPEHVVKAAQLTDLVITHILHVQGNDQYLEGYYNKFITDPSGEFEARFGYVIAMVDLLDQMGALQKDLAQKTIRSPRGLWGQARKSAEKARRMLKGLSLADDPDNKFLRCSYQAMDQFRIAVVNIYHRLDSANGNSSNGPYYDKRAS